VSEPIPQRDALRLQLAILAGNEPERSYLEMRWRRPGGRMGQCFHGCRGGWGIVDTIVNIGKHTDVHVGAAPRVAKRGGLDAVARAWCLWADCDSDEAVRRLRAFRPLPSIVIKSGSNGNLHAFWQLSHPLTRAAAKRANLRLATALGADRAVCHAAALMRPAGTFNFKHDPPRPVECICLELDAYTMPEVIGGLDDLEVSPRPRRSLPPVTGGSPAAVDGVLRIVRNAPAGERNSRLNWASYTLGQKISGGSIGEVDAIIQLRAAADAVGLPEQEADRTIRSGLDAGAQA
jgi:hypothetical protein